MRVSTSQIFSASLLQLNSSLSDVVRLNQINTSQKRINAPSDDPSGMAKVVNLRSYDSALARYADTCSTADSYLSLADTQLAKASEKITSALEVAEQASTETYTTTQMRQMSTELSGYLDAILSIANSKMGEDYVFGGDDLNSSAFEMGLGATVTGEDMSASDVLSVTGEADTTIAVRFTSDGTVGASSLTYEYSIDGGETWTSGTLASGASSLDLGGCQVALASGASLTASDGEGGGCEFLVRKAVYYTGGDQAMSVAISQGVEVDMTSVGSDIFGGVDPDTGQAYSGANLFESICECIAYMDMGDSDKVADCLETISAAQERLETGAAGIGSRETKISAVESSISQIRSVTTTSISGEEDADLTQVLVELEQANYVYEAVLSSTSSIMKMSLLDYL
ncbi:flagellar hook protein [Desulfovibrio aminophilus]|uniref:flagellin N-terminal helical domain-containing protein n=1 Tax=Desulfovibrio aminophilus TaxID=81425 RepID=UPI003396EF45